MENKFSKTKIFEVLSEITLDIEGSNLSKTGWYPTGDYETEYMSKQEIEEALSEAERQDSKVLFNNILLDWDRCDCNDGMCSHGSWVCEIIIVSDKRHTLEVEDDGIRAYNNEKTASVPSDATAYDFYRMCELVGIKLEFSEYAKKLLS